MAFAETWDATFESEPADSEGAKLGAQRIRNLKVDIRERMAIEHSWAGDANDGKHIYAAPTVLTSTTNSIAIDLSVNDEFTHTFTENTTLAAPSNPVAGQRICIGFTQHASAPKTLAFASFWKFPGGVVPAATATAGAFDLFVAHIDSATRATCQLLNDSK